MKKFEFDRFWIKFALWVIFLFVLLSVIITGFEKVKHKMIDDARLQRVISYKEQASRLASSDDKPDCKNILRDKDPLLRYIYTAVICQGKNPDDIPNNLSEDETKVLVPRQL